MNQRVDIHKAGGVILKDRRLLVTRSAGKDVFVAPGGKLENGETPEEALEREIMEEVRVKIDVSRLEKLGTFQAIAAGHEDKTLEMNVFIIHEMFGEPIPSSEVEEIMWVNSQTKDVALGSIFEHDVIPLLKQKNLID
jgi:mutator protein MutT